GRPRGNGPRQRHSDGRRARRRRGGRAAGAGAARCRPPGPGARGAGQRRHDPGKPPHPGEGVRSGTLLRGGTRPLVLHELSQLDRGAHPADAARRRRVANPPRRGDRGAGPLPPPPAHLRGLLPRLNGLMWGSAAAALLTAVLGMVSTVFMTLLERRREIGLLKALGAEDATISGLFIGEALLLGLIGGLTGWLLGQGLGWILA